MFDTLSERFSDVFDRLTRQGVISEKDVDAALKDIRIALLDADVALPVVKSFIAKIRIEAVGESVIRSVSPGQQIIKIVHDGLVRMLGGQDTLPELKIDVPPAIIMMAGLQGSGKTTSTAKLARRLKQRHNKKVLVASLDVRRPAAMEQLRILAEQAEVGFLPVIEGQLPRDIAKRSCNAAQIGGYDVLLLDTAGRITLDEQMMQEASDIADIAKPSEVLLVADALTGQDALHTAERFHARLPLTGLILTRMDGDGRGGAALSMRAATGLPIKFLGTGEKLDGLDEFDAQRIAGRILGQGDIVSLVEKASDQFEQEKAEKMARKMAKGTFDLDDMAEQFRQLRQMGGLSGVMGMLPGSKKAKQAMSAGHMDDKTLKRQEAVISSMTLKERQKPALLNASRKRRIAKGAGVEVQEVNKVIKMHRQMADMVKKMGKGGMKGLMGAMSGSGMNPADLARMGGSFPGTPGGLPGLGGSGLPGTGLPGGLPGLGGPKK